MALASAAPYGSEQLTRIATMEPSANTDVQNLATEVPDAGQARQSRGSLGGEDHPSVHGRREQTTTPPTGVANLMDVEPSSRRYEPMYFTADVGTNKSTAPGRREQAPSPAPSTQELGTSDSGHAAETQETTAQIRDMDRQVQANVQEAIKHSRMTKRLVEVVDSMAGAVDQHFHAIQSATQRAKHRREQRLQSAAIEAAEISSDDETGTSTDTTTWPWRRLHGFIILALGKCQLGHQPETQAQGLRRNATSV